MQVPTLAQQPSPMPHKLPQHHPPQPQPQPEFFVHEYTPPADLKRAATPRSKLPAVEFVGAGGAAHGLGLGGSATGGPKSYTFAHSGPEHFEGKKEKDREGGAKKAAVPSPASSNGGVGTST